MEGQTTTGDEFNFADYDNDGEYNVHNPDNYRII